MYRTYLRLLGFIFLTAAQAEDGQSDKRSSEHNLLATLLGDTGVLVGETPGEVETFEDVKFNYSLTCNKTLKLLERRQNFTRHPTEISVSVAVNDTAIAQLELLNSITKKYELNCKNGMSVAIPVTAGHLGITRMSITVNIGEFDVSAVEDVEIRVKRKVTLFDELSFFILTPLILLNKCAFGAKIEIDTLKHIFTQPLALTLCLFMQFVGMPLLALLYATAFRLSQSLALALFVAATCPGGGGGYVISYLVGGDVTLAISASLLSTMVAMGAMPGVIGLYAHFANIPDNIAIPYVKIIIILCAIGVPISTGMLIKRKWPTFAEKFVKIIRPLSLFLIFCGFTFLAVSSKYIIYGPTVGWALAVAVPSSGFILSIIFARCLGLSWPFAKAISLESGMKNTVLGIAVIELTYPQPEADLSSILIIMVTLGHTTLAMLWYFGYLIREKCCKTEQEHAEFMKLEQMDSDSESDDEKIEFVALKT